MTNAPRMHHRKREPDEVPSVGRSRSLRQMTRRELWSQIGVAAAGWIIVLALTRLWWRVYRVVSQ